VTPSAPASGDSSSLAAPKGAGSLEPVEPPEPPAGRPRPSLRERVRPAAPLLDAVLPGLGHLLAGRREFAAAFGIPTLFLIGAVALLVVTTSLAKLAAEAINAFAVLFLLQGLVLIWRLLAIATSLRGSRSASIGSASTGSSAGFRVGAALLVGFVIVPQVWLGYVTNVAREEVDRVFSAAVVPEEEPEASFAPDPSALTAPEPSLIPEPTATPGPAARVNILLLGIDSGVGRNTALTDTMIVASLDPVTQTVSMVSVPRDMVGVPLPDGRKYNQKINSLHAYARHNPKLFPGSDGTGNDVLMGALGTLLGLRIDYYASVNLPGFVQVVDALGGVDVKVARAFCDPSYDEYGFTKGFSISAGWHHLNGQQALAYARVRKASGESDFTRAARQQEVIAGLRDGIVSRGLLSDLVGMMRAIGQTLQTNVPREMLPELADVMTRIDRTKTYRAVIDHPLVVSDFDDRGSIQVPDLKGIKTLASHLFPEPGVLPDLDYLSVPPPPESTDGSAATAAPEVGPPSGDLTSGVKGCSYAPAPAPTRRPTAAPTAAPTEAPTPTPTPQPTKTAAPKPTGTKGG
jgi:LCP family protein required for cell wall assembly